MNNNGRLIAGIFSFFLLGLIVVGPLYLSEKLEAVETSQSGLISFDELISQQSVNDTIMGYTPYIEHNSSTDQIRYWSGANRVDPFISYGTTAYTSRIVYNYDELRDRLGDGTSGSTQYYFNYFLSVDTEYMLENNINTLYLYFDIGAKEIRVHKMSWEGLDVNNIKIYELGMNDKLLDTASFHTGPVETTITFTTEELNDIHSTVGGASQQCLYIQGQMNSLVSEIYVISDIQIGPEYYELTDEEIIFENSTVRTYEPYIQSITPFAVHKVSMGLGGILIIGFGWIASPFNKHFNNSIPVNGIKRRLSR